MVIAFGRCLFVADLREPLRLLSTTPSTPGHTRDESLLLWVYWLLFPGDLLFTRLWLYLALSVLGLILVLAAWAKSRAGWLGRAALVIGLLAIVALPLVYRYEPAVRVAPEYEAQVITQPGRLAGVVKRMQTGAEVRACEYELLGWSASQGALYGKEACGERVRLWTYRPASDERLHEVQTLPADIVQETIARTELEGVRSTIHQDASLRLAVQQPILVSPGGAWHALVARHIYGPEDVIVIATNPSEH